MYPVHPIIIMAASAFTITLIVTRSWLVERLVIRRISWLPLATFLSCPMCVGAWAVVGVWFTTDSPLYYACIAYIFVVFLMAMYDSLQRPGLL